LEKKEKDGQTDQERSHRPRNKEPRVHPSKPCKTVGHLQETCLLAIALPRWLLPTMGLKVSIVYLRKKYFP